MKILVIDNYDSFVYNLVHILRGLGYRPDIFRNDAITLEEVSLYDKILISPGPGIPEEASIILALIKKFASEKSILGICLGHQAIAEAFGAKLHNLPEVLHGVSSELQIKDNSEILFDNIPQNAKIGHYHSWVVNPETLHEDIKITALDTENNIMALSHKTFDVKGLQFHPESIMTDFGTRIIQNWLDK